MVKDHRKRLVINTGCLSLLINHKIEDKDLGITASKKRRQMITTDVTLPLNQPVQEACYLSFRERCKPTMRYTHISCVCIKHLIGYAKES